MYCHPTYPNLRPVDRFSDNFSKRIKLAFCLINQIKIFKTLKTDFYEQHYQT